MTQQDLMHMTVVHYHTVNEQMLNINGTLFGGTAMGWMDKAGHELSIDLTGKTMYTFTVDKIKFIKPVFLHETVEVLAQPYELGPVKLVLQLTLTADPNGPNRRTAITGLFTFVQVDEQYRPHRIQYRQETEGIC